MSDYILNPDQGDILPVTVSEVKLYEGATKGIYGESKRLRLSLDNSLEIKEYCMEVSHKFGWEALINVPDKYVGDGTSSNKINMLEQPEAMLMQMVRVQAAVTWSTVNFMAGTVLTNTVTDVDP